MARQAHAQADHQLLANHDDVCRAFRHISEIKVFKILALRPTTKELEDVARRLCASGRGKRDKDFAGVPGAIIDILAGNDRP